MRRREFITAVGGAAIWPMMVRAQQSAMPAVGFLHSGLEAQSPHVIGFRKGLDEIGFVQGRNVDVLYRFAEGHYDRLPAIAAELVNRQVAVLAATGGVHTALAAKSATKKIPVVFANGSDPVQFGLVESLNRPGGNITGVSFFTKPADLPVMQATKFEFVINLKTAKSLGLTLPPGPLSTADDVIE